MKNWLELEDRFRRLGEKDGELTLLLLEGDQGASYKIMHGKSATQRELESLAALAGKHLSRALKKSDPSLNEKNLQIRWWKFLKDRSRSVFLSGQGWSRATIGGPLANHQHGLIRNVALECANVCLQLENEHPLQTEFNLLRWLHDNYIKALILATIGAIITAVIRSITGSP